MSLSPFGRFKPKLDAVRVRAQQPDETTLRSFGGGLNLTDSEIKLTTKFAVVLDNAHVEADESISSRFGTRYKWKVNPTVNGNIIDGIYFRGKIVVVTNQGEVATIDDDGTVTAIWNTAIAGALVGAPSAWGLTLQVDFTDFKNELVICNGVDKPIKLDKNHVVDYLQDVATGSNIFTPIAKYCTTVGNYLVMAGVPSSPDDIYISAAGTSGTWPGDPAPNDAISINIASYNAQTGGDLRGISEFRNLLIVHFATTSLVVVLGEYEGVVHKPRILDTLADQGVICHRMTVVAGQELVFADESGVFKAKKNAYGTGLDNERLQHSIKVEFIDSVGLTEADRINSFSIHNKNENRILFFVKKDGDWQIWVLSYRDGFKYRTWSTYSGWEFVGGCVSSKGRVFFFKGDKIYQLGNQEFENELFVTDLEGDYTAGTWATLTAYVIGDRVLKDGSVFRARENHVSGDFDIDLEAEKWEAFIGDPIDFDWELPWSDINKRMTKKRLTHVALDTQGEASFNFEAYTDSVRYDSGGNDDPALSIEFTAGNTPGWGGGDQPFGGGRRTIDERLWGFPCEFKLLKLRIAGLLTKRLKIDGITLLMTKGTFKR